VRIAPADADPEVPRCGRSAGRFLQHCANRVASRYDGVAHWIRGVEVAQHLLRLRPAAQGRFDIRDRLCRS